jgi:hypothetical protein
MTALTSLSINKRQLDERGNSPGWMWVESGLYHGEAHYSDDYPAPEGSTGELRLVISTNVYCEPIWIMQAKEIESA